MAKTRESARTAAITPQTYETFGTLLKYLRRRAGLTQRQLALAVGYSESQISRLEKDERAPDEAPHPSSDPATSATADVARTEPDPHRDRTPSRVDALCLPSVILLEPDWRARYRRRGSLPRLPEGPRHASVERLPQCSTFPTAVQETLV